MIDFSCKKWSDVKKEKLTFLVGRFWFKSSALLCHTVNKL